MGRTENLIDPPLTEQDAKMLHIFYEQFLGKESSDSLALLKAVTLLRRSDLREHIHTFAMMHKRLETLLPSTRKRELILSFPSTIQRVNEVVWEGEEAYGSDGATVMSILGSQASDYLDQTEMFRLDLDSLLEDCPSMIPDDAAALAYAANSGSGEFLYLLIALADQLFAVLLPHDHPQPTEAVLRVRNFLQEHLGEKFEDQIIEFFVIGGGYVRISGKKVVIYGVHPLFDPAFADFGKPESDRLLTEFVRGKSRLAVETFRTELPDRQFVVQG